MPLPMSFGRRVGMPVGSQALDQFFHLLESEFLVRHLPAAEAQGDLHLHVFAEKIHRVLQLDAEIMRVNVGAESGFP